MSKLGDHIEYVKGFAFKSKDYTETGIPVIRVSNFTDNSIDIKDVYHIPKERFSEFQKVNLIKDDIVIATVGSWPTNPSSVVGKTIRVPPEANNTLLNQNAVRIRSLDKDEQLYFYYVLKDKSFSDYIISTAQGSANQASITLKSILDYDLPNIDSKEKRIKIGKTLATYDEKIQLNTQINQTLEQIAQALFKSWFVDFDPVRAKVQALSDGLNLEQAELAAMQAISGKTSEELTALSQTQPDRYTELAETAKAFPCEMVEVDGVEVPKGWELSTIGDCYDVVMGQSPKGETYNENKQGMLFYQGRAEFGWRFPTPRLFTTDPKRIAEQNSILMSVRAPVGDINIALEKCCIGRGLAALQHKSKNMSFGLYQIQSIKPELDLFNGEGTVFGSINQANLKNIQIINPDEKFIQLFEKKLSSCDSKIMNNEIENNALKEIRDLLLPRLLSGDFND
jgi:putative type-1 restriction enzyme hindVIIP specificity protein